MTWAAARLTCPCLDVGDGVFEVRSTAGDTRLGGDDWDERIVSYVADEFKKEQGIDLRKDKQAMQRLREAAEKAKIELSNVVTANINLPFITADADGPKHLDVTLTRAKFEEMTRDLLARTEEPFNRSLKDAGIDASAVDEIILVGGSTRMPQVQELVKKARRRQGTQPFGQPGRSGRHRGRDTGGCLRRRSQGRGAFRRHPAVAGHSDAGRYVHQTD